MPELPEVEIVRRALAASLTGATLVSAATDPSSRWSAAKEAVSCEVLDVSRRGKYILFHLSDSNFLVLHLGMTGQLLLNPSEVPPKHVRLDLGFESPAARLLLVDPRGFGQARVLSKDDLSDPAFGTLALLGQDPLSVSFDEKRAAADLRRFSAKAPVKAALLAQRALAGVGNYLADEALWAARVHPAASGISSQAALRVVREYVLFVRAALDAGGVSVRDYVHADGSKGSAQLLLRAYGRGGEPCERCSAILVKSVVAGRSSVWCPRCTPAP